MTTITASQARIPPETFNQVAYQGDIVQVIHRNGTAVYVISEADMATLANLKQNQSRSIQESVERIDHKYGDILRRLAE